MKQDNPRINHIYFFYLSFRQFVDYLFLGYTWSFPYIRVVKNYHSSVFHARGEDLKLRLDRPFNRIEQSSFCVFILRTCNLNLLTLLINDHLFIIGSVTSVWPGLSVGQSVFHNLPKGQEVTTKFLKFYVISRAWNN